MSGLVTCAPSGGLRRSTIRNYARSVAGFCEYATDPCTGEPEPRFGSHPVQVRHEWNIAVR
jgi:integrase/recombinase XerC